MLRTTASSPEFDSDSRIPETCRPSGYCNPQPSGRYNLVVIGGGVSGIAAALGGAALGARVALIEHDRLGGSHLHGTGLPVHVLSRLAARYRFEAQFHHNTPGWIGRQIRLMLTQTAPAYSLAKLRESGVDVYFGIARFRSRAQVEVEDRQLQFARAIIASGTTPVIPDWAAALTGCLLTPEHLSRLEQLPHRLAVVGATPLGVALAQAFARFGSEVTLFGAGTAFLSGFDPEAISFIRHAVERDGVRVRLDDHILSATAGDDGCRLRTNQAELETFDEVLTAMGVRPRLDGLQLEAAGILRDETGLLLDDHLSTSNPRVYAAGEVIPGIEGAEAATATAQIALANSLFLATSRRSRLLIPHCVLTCPQLAQIGIQPGESRRGHFKVMHVPFAKLEGAILDDDAEGFLKIVHDHHGAVRGATVVSKHAPALAELVGLIIHHGPRLGALGTDVFAGRTLAESLHKAAENYRRTLLTPAVMKFLKRLLKWRR